MTVLGKEGVVVKVLGDLGDGRIPDGVGDDLTRLEGDMTMAWTTREGKDGGGGGGEEEPLTLCLALNYGGRTDIVMAARKMAKLIADGDIPPSLSDEEVLDGLLCTSGIPDPDMVIRTGGERRMSNFLIWNCAYSELYFTDVLWPDFDGVQMDKALEWYRGRERRFGGRIGSKERLDGEMDCD